LAAYVGAYEVGPGLVLTVTQEGDRLFAQPTGSTRAELFPESETRFFLKVTDVQIEFVKNAAGTVTHLVRHQGGQERQATRK
jgi:hypothetical protein